MRNEGLSRLVSCLDKLGKFCNYALCFLYFQVMFNSFLDSGGVEDKLYSHRQFNLLTIERDDINLEDGF